MKSTLLISAIAATLSSFAQPVITDGSNLQPIGSSNPGVTVNVTDIGTGGANQTWDFSMQGTSNLANLSVIDLASSSFASSFPTSSWTFQLGPFYSYFNISSTEMNSLAFNINTTGGNGDYSANPRKVMAFPFSYGDFFSDSYMENGSTENLTVTYEGYGTLLMPGGFTYTNVIRVKEEEQISGVVTTRFYLNDPLTIVATHISNSGIFFWAQVVQPNSIDENSQNRLSVYPNPVENELNLSGFNNSATETKISGLDGKLIKTIDLNSNSGTQTVDVSMLENGWYLVSDGFTSIQFLKCD